MSTSSSLFPFEENADGLFASEPVEEFASLLEGADNPLLEEGSLLGSELEGSFAATPTFLEERLLFEKDKLTTSAASKNTASKNTASKNTASPECDTGPEYNPSIEYNKVLQEKVLSFKDPLPVADFAINTQAKPVASLPKEAEVEVKDVQMSFRRASDVIFFENALKDQTLRVYSPGGVSGLLPVILWVHGTAWSLFGVDTHDAFCRFLVKSTGAMVASPNYEQDLDAGQVSAPDSVLRAYRWVYDNAVSLGADPSLMGIGGESTGASAALATVLRLSALRSNLPLAQVYIHPLTVKKSLPLVKSGNLVPKASDALSATFPLFSWVGTRQNEVKPFFEKRAFMRESLRSSVPFFKNPTELPPALVVLDERDVMLSQGQRFVKNLFKVAQTQLSQKIEVLYYNNIVHEFFSTSASSKAKLAKDEVAEHFKSAFSKFEPYPVDAEEDTLS